MHSITARFIAHLRISPQWRDQVTLPAEDSRLDPFSQQLMKVSIIM